MTATAIAILIAWCTDNGVQIDPRLQIRETENGLTVFSVNAYIGNPVSLVKIPKFAVLSVKSCSLSDFLTVVPFGHGVQLSLALALYAEILIGSESRWYGYLQSLPQDLVDIALFWGCDVSTSDTDINNGIAPGETSKPKGTDSHLSQRRALDGTEALTWLRGTEVEKQLRGSEDVTTSLLDEVREHYFTAVAPLLSRLDHHPTLRGFYHAYSLVSSRAFLVDAYHGLAMVPVADIFNHSQDNHVHLETDYDVCSTCGSVRECVHDKETGLVDGATTTTSEEKEQDGYYEMISNAPILPESEVFNTYGEKLGNAELLARYGFSVEGNEHDRISWEVDEVEGKSERIMELWGGVVERWSEEVFLESGLVFTNGVGGRELCVNGDGKVTHQMWLYCGLVKLDEVVGTGEIEEALEMLREVADLQLILEKMMVGEVDMSGIGWVTGKSPVDVRFIIISLVRSMILSLCRAKKGDTVTNELCSLADELPEDMRRTRLAIAQAITERSILDCCEANWTELLPSSVRI